jgi:hypothetical protein
MVQRPNDAVVKDAQVKLGKEGCALSMGQRTNLENYAAVKDAQINLIEEECALDIELRSNDAVLKDKVNHNLVW